MRNELFSSQISDFQLFTVSYSLRWKFSGFGYSEIFFYLLLLLCLIIFCVLTSVEIRGNKLRNQDQKKGGRVFKLRGNREVYKNAKLLVSLSVILIEIFIFQHWACWWQILHHLKMKPYLGRKTSWSYFTSNIFHSKTFWGLFMGSYVMWRLRSWA